MVTTKATTAETPQGQLRTGPKRVVYLWGAGATQSEADVSGAPPVALLMRDVSGLLGVASCVLEKLRVDGGFTVDPGRDRVDIEKVIALLAGSGVSKLVQRAERMRQYYFETIRDKLAAAKILDNPRLAIGLFEMHKHPHFRENVEELAAVITTNHDGLLQVASQRVYGGVRLGFPFETSDRFNDGGQNDGIPPILQLHGSFTWRQGVPLRLKKLGGRTPYAADTVWIAPTVAKESKTYPFNKLAALSYEFLVKRCDVLRIIGCSLTQNDWNILSMIFNAQRHLEYLEKPVFRIEVITSHKGGTWIQEDCSFLRSVTPIGFLSEGRLADYKDLESKDWRPEMKNYFAYWLGEKVRYHKNQGHFGKQELDQRIAQVMGAER